jgi:hypothetical protein
MSPIQRSTRVIPVTMVLLALSALTTLPAAGQAEHPDITGRWTLNKQRSVMGERVSIPLAIDIRISLEDGKYTFKRIDETMRGGRSRYDEVFTTDGEANEIELESGKMTITAKWMNNSLVVDRSRPMARGGGGRRGGGGGATRSMTYTTTYTLSPDGKTLIAFVDFGRMPTDPLTLAYEKK